jgi:hypothetical protein
VIREEYRLFADHGIQINRARPTLTGEILLIRPTRLPAGRQLSYDFISEISVFSESEDSKKAHEANGDGKNIAQSAKRGRGLGQLD